MDWMLKLQLVARNVKFISPVGLESSRTICCKRKFETKHYVFDLRSQRMCAKLTLFSSLWDGRLLLKPACHNATKRKNNQNLKPRCKTVEQSSRIFNIISNVWQRIYNCKTNCFQENTKAQLEDNKINRKFKWLHISKTIHQFKVPRQVLVIYIQVAFRNYAN